ncbi:MAG: hypothetical protein ABIS51_06065 [Sphingomonas sp.]
MVSGIFFLIIFAAVGCFMATRVYLLVTAGELNVKGRVYSRSETPGAYGVSLACAILGTIFCFVMVLAGAVAMAHGQ